MSLNFKEKQVLAAIGPDVRDGLHASCYDYKQQKWRTYEKPETSFTRENFRRIILKRYAQ